MSQKTDNLIKLALVFFVSLLSFSIGTYVGKKYSDNQHKLALLEPQKESTVKTTEEFATEANATEAEKQLNEVASEGPTPEAVIASEKPAALTDSEVAKIAEEFASEEEEAEERIVATIEPAEKVVKTIPEQPRVNGQINSPKATTLTAATVVQPKKVEAVAKPVTAKTTNALPPKIVPNRSADAVAVAPTPVDSENRNPASLPPTTEMVPIHYTVQIGSFPTESEADSLTKSLQNKGYKTSYVPAKVNGQIWYRVNVGLFGTIKEAQDYKREFLEKTKLTSAIVQRLQH